MRGRGRVCLPAGVRPQLYAGAETETSSGGRLFVQATSPTSPGAMSIPGQTRRTTPVEGGPRGEGQCGGHIEAPSAFATRS